MSKPSVRFLLRDATRAAHDALEAAPVMARLQGARPSAGAVATALSAQFQVYAAVELALLAARPRCLALHPGYRPRAPLAAADLARLGMSAPPEPRPIDRFGSDAAWWGWFYVADGASLGGALIMRRLAESAPDLPRLTFFDPYGAARSGVWRALCQRLDTALTDPAAVAEAVNGATAAFALFAEALGADHASAAA